MDFGYLHLSPALPLFRERYPDLKLEIEYSDRRVALVEEGFDLALRIGNLPDSSTVAKPLAMMRLEVCASPAYLARRGTPNTPEDLKQHDCLLYTLTQPDWVFKRDGEQLSVRPQGPLRANNGVALTRAACDDQGIILQPTFIVGDALRSGAWYHCCRSGRRGWWGSMPSIRTAASSRPRCAVSSNSCRSVISPPLLGSQGLSLAAVTGWLRGDAIGRQRQLGHQQQAAQVQLPARQALAQGRQLRLVKGIGQGDVQAVAVEHAGQLQGQDEIGLIGLVLVDALAQFVAKMGLGIWVIACQP